MLTFKPVSKRDAARLQKYYVNCNYRLCEYSVGVKLMWRTVLKPAWAEAAGCLIVRCGDKGRYSFDYPVPLDDGDEDAALEAIEQYCIEQGTPPVLSIVPEAKAARLLRRYPYVRVSNIRTWQDYLYRREDLQLFIGRRYSGQRNHIKKFRAQWPAARFRRLTGADAAALRQFWADFQAEFPKGDSPGARKELRLAQELFTQLERPWFLAGGMFDGDRLIAVSLCERCGETLIIHVEKALYSYTGVYPAMVQSEVEAFGQDCVYVNREDDAADRGLRTSKLQYGPARLESKLRFEPQNELVRHVERIPVLTTPRLTLSELTEADVPAYNALVQDAERNRWWGYDDVGALGAPVTERSFFEVAKRDFQDRLAVNFAVRLDGRLIGEAVLYRFDYRGGAELGCRISRDFAHCGYGTEAFAAVADWALYQAHLSRVVAKCFKDNEASYRMLSSCMRRSGEDETYFYFEKLV